MAIDNPPAFLQASAYSASRDRLNLISARFLPTFLNTTDVAARGGFLMGQSGRAANFSMTNWDVTVGRFIAVVENAFASQPGDYQVLNIASQVLAVTPSSPTTNRIDIIGVRVQDAFYSGALNQADIVVVEGTATAGTPSDPALPSSFLPIVRVTVNANTSTGILTDLRRRTATPGAVYQPYTPQLADVGSAIGEVQLLPAASPYPARLRVWDGSVWRGVTPFAFAPVTQTSTPTLTGLSDAVLASLSVADPGFQYKVRGSAHMEWRQTPAANGAVAVAVVTLDTTSWDGTGGQVVAAGYGRSIADLGSATSQTPVEAAYGTSGVLTGAHTARLIARKNDSNGSVVILESSFYPPRMSIEMVPS